MSPANRLRWCLLVHALPARPLYLRARIRRRLAEAGAAPLKNSVYAGPWSESLLRSFAAIADEIRGAGASAFVCEATFPDEESERSVVEAFNADRRAAYRGWIERARRLPAPVRPATLARLRAGLAALRERDVLAAAGSDEAEAVLADLERRAAPRAGARRLPASGRRGLQGLRWVTRRGLHVDRLACAWVVRRFIDPSAGFRFVASAEAPRRAGEIGFDMTGAEIGHEDGRCSVETLARRARIEDPHVRRITEIVHDVDLGDGRYGHPESAGFAALLVGMLVSHPDDEARLSRGLELFDALYASLSGARGPAGRASLPPGVRVPAALRRPRRG